MDDLRLNRPPPEPRSPRGNARFFVIAIAIAAGLHLVVFGALALTAHRAKAVTTSDPTPSEPTTPAVTPIANSAIRAPAAMAADIQSVPAGTEAAPALRPRPVEHVPVHKPQHPAHAAGSPPKKSEPQIHEDKAGKAKAKAKAKLKPEKTPLNKAKPVHGKAQKSAPANAKRAPTKPQPKTKASSKPASTLDLDALSKFKSGN